MAFLGMRGNGDWATDQRPKNWRQMILHEFPNGDAPLTAIASMMKSESTDDPEFNWWDKELATERAAVGIYTDAALGTAYVYATHQATKGIAGATVYAKMTEALSNQFRAGMTVVMRDTDRSDVEMVGRISGVTKNGASSSVAIVLREDDDNSATSATYNLATVDMIQAIGSSQPEGSAMPESVAYDPTKYYNYTQIFETPLEFTRTARKTKLRTGDQYQEAKREALELHGKQMEYGSIFGRKFEGTGDNKKPIRESQGWVEFIKTYASDNVSDFSLASDYAGETWLDKGDEYLDDILEVIFRFGKDEKLGLIGSGALKALTQLAKSHGFINLTPGVTDYGLRVISWIHSAGVLHLKRHPLFSYEATLRNNLLIIEPEQMTFRPIDDTFFKEDPNKKARTGGRLSFDATKESYLTEGGYEFHFAKRHGYVQNLGVDSTV